MAYAHHERLSATDLSFLATENGRVHMHIGSVTLFEAEPLLREGGGLDFERILSFIDAQLFKVPRMRQKLEWVPGIGHPVWVDDPHFNLAYHVRHTALPPPGEIRQLKRLAGRILSQEFDRGKPLWEYWFVDNVEGGRFALIGKLHHCMADGITGVAIGNLLVGPSPNYKPGPAKKWIPRPAPSKAQLVLDDLRHRLQVPWKLVREPGNGGFSGGPVGPRKALQGLVDTVRNNVGRGGTPTPLNVEVGAHRRFDWLRLPLAEVRAIGKGVGGKVNDVVLAVASGALRNFLRKRGVDVSSQDFHALTPVSLRKQGGSQQLGNRISGLLAALPLDEPDPMQRLLRVVETTHELKSSGQSGAGEFLLRVADLIPAPLLGPLYRRGVRSQMANMIITNVPGPKVPVYLLGARELETYPVVPLMPEQALGIALMSYDGGLYWGLNADWDAVPDLHDLVQDLERGFRELEAAVLARPSGA